MTEFITRDSGQRQVFDTGSQRDTRTGKGRYDLISPIALKRLAQVLERGAEKYGERNWELGQPISRYMDSAIRHIYQYLEGYDDEDHLGQAAFNIFGAIHTEEMSKRGLLPFVLRDTQSYMEVTQEEECDIGSGGFVESEHTRGYRFQPTSVRGMGAASSQGPVRNIKNIMYPPGPSVGSQ